MNQKAIIEQRTKSVIELISSINFDKVGEILIEDGAVKGVQIWNDFKVSVAEFRITKNNFENRGENLTLIECAILCASLLSASLGILMQGIKLTHYVRTHTVLSVNREIDINKSVQELNKLDVLLTQFVEYNHLTAVDGYDKYPIHLIQQGREQLNRISLNYGRETKFKNNGDKNTDFDEIIEFPVDIFLTQSNYQLFIYLVDNYAMAKRPVDLSHIFRWMDENDLIAKRIGKKYMNYCVKNHFVNGKFTRLSDPNKLTRTPLNQLKKTFETIASKNE